MLLLVLRDLQYRKWRVIMSVFLMAVVITLLFVMTGIVNQFRFEPFAASEQVAGDRVWVVADGPTAPFTGSPLLPNSELGPSAEPFLIGDGRVDDERVIVVARLFNTSAQLQLAEGRVPAAAGEIVIDESADFNVGEQVMLNGASAEIVGLTSEAIITAGVPLVFATLDFGQELIVRDQKLITGWLVDTTPDTLPAGLKVMTSTQVGDDALTLLDDAIGSISIVRALLWLVTFVVIAAIVYVSALERTRDFAVLKAVGAKNSSLAFQIIAQAVIMALLAVLIAAILQRFLAPLFPMAVRVPASAAWQMPLGALVVAALAAAAGVWKVANTPASEAFG